jgi:heme a synthase
MSLTIPNTYLNSYRSANKATVIAVFLLILVGGIVRSTGSGMGCPDWPKCFGSYIPPTHVDELPVNYKELYLQKRIEKNERFVVLLQNMGFHSQARAIAEDKSIIIEEDFNAIKTWIEYINRLVGVVIGLLILFTAFKSLKFWRYDKIIPIVSVFNVLLVIFQAWIGSIVVSTNLLHWMITVHMVLALVLVCLLIYTYHRAGRHIIGSRFLSINPHLIHRILLVGFVLVFIQVVLGTQVREQVDVISFQLGNLMRETWIENLGIVFFIHRSYSILLVVVHLWFLNLVYKYGHRTSKVYKNSLILIFLILLEIFTGISMAYFAIPAFLQPIHLLVGSLIIGVQFYLLLELNVEKRFSLNNKNHE